VFHVTQNLQAHVKSQTHFFNNRNQIVFKRFDRFSRYRSSPVAAKSYNNNNNNDDDDDTREAFVALRAE
jgi:hypothetical protein